MSRLAEPNTLTIRHSTLDPSSSFELCATIATPIYRRRSGDDPGNTQQRPLAGVVFRRLYPPNAGACGGPSGDPGLMLFRITDPFAFFW